MSAAAGGSRREARLWEEMLNEAEAWLPEAREADVTGFDPATDLNRRGRWWGHVFPSTVLPHVLAFGVALAEAEVHGWETDDPVTATRAFEDRRFLFGDRLVHWVVPASYTVPGAAALRERLLDMGDRMRPAPLLTGPEGLHPPGEDSFGPEAVGLRVSFGSAERWERLAVAHPGTARLWTDLAVRAGGSFSP